MCKSINSRTLRFSWELSRSRSGEVRQGFKEEVDLIRVSILGHMLLNTVLITTGGSCDRCPYSQLEGVLGWNSLKAEPGEHAGVQTFI